LLATISAHTRNRIKRLLFRTLAVKQTLGSRAGNAVLLTFDDGPHADVTPGVLERLERHGVRAAFFVVGKRIRRAPDLLPQIVRAGHTLGNHTFAHVLDRSLGLKGYIQDIGKCQVLVESLTGIAPRLFRPPQGRTTFGSLAAPMLLGLKTVRWSVDPQDWRLRQAAEARALGERLVGKIGAGDIVLLHDDNPCVLTVLDVLLPGLIERGFDLRSGVSLL
jgi:peptidoglycan/xylan/chitin deacetylase (PgdA/CDA1 family)